MRIDAFRPADDFKSHMDNWIKRFKGSKPIPGHDRVLIPGDPEREFEKERIKSGIPLNEKVEQDLKDLAERFQVEL